MNLSIIVVDYKTTTQVKNLAKKLTSPSWEIITVDNNKKNRGYGGGLNFGTSRSSGEYLLFLNPDIEIEKKDIQMLLTFLQKNESVAAVGPQFVDTLGAIVPSSLGEFTFGGALVGLSFLRRVLPYNSFSKQFWLPDWDRKTTRDVAIINGACMMVRRSDFQAIGGFDESFFLYWEENDLCNRMKMMGKRIIFFP